MTSDTVEEIGYVLGMGRNVVRQKKAFEYVIITTEKSSSELAADIIQAGEGLPEIIDSAAQRVASCIKAIHNELGDKTLPQKWQSLFSEEEFIAIKELPQWRKRKGFTVYFDNSFHAEKNKTEFAVKVIRNSVQHYLEDIKYYGKREELNPEEQKLLEQFKNPEEAKRSKLSSVFDEQTVYNLWEMGILQCDINR